jgi:hypothetical protein
MKPKLTIEYPTEDLSSLDRNDETMLALRSELEKEREKLICGHRKIDWDDSYGGCAFCGLKELADKADDYLGELNRMNDRYKEAEKRVKELEIQLAEAQQWIDSEPGWKEKYMDRYMSLLKLNMKLDEKRMSLETRLKELEDKEEILGIADELYQVYNNVGGENG